MSCYSKVLMSLDRLMTVQTHKWRTFFSAKQAVFACLGCAMFFIVGCVNVLLNFGEVANANGTRTVFCFYTGSTQTAWMAIWDMVRKFLSTHEKFDVDCKP